MSKMEEKPNRKRINMKSHLCIPRLMRSNNTCTAAASSTPTTKRLSPMSLLERFREAVFRLIMLTALSKATHNDAAATGSVVDTQRSYYPPPQHDPHHSEAVAECIEFIKKSASTTDENRDSTASNTTSNINDANTEVVIVPVPVM